MTWGLLRVCAVCPTARLNWRSSSVPPGKKSTIFSPPGTCRIHLSLKLDHILRIYPPTFQLRPPKHATPRILWRVSFYFGICEVRCQWKTAEKGKIFVRGQLYSLLWKTAHTFTSIFGSTKCFMYGILEIKRFQCFCRWTYPVYRATHNGLLRNRIKPSDGNYWPTEGLFGKRNV
jgi:hypothetical protein